MGLVDSHAHLTFPELADQIEPVMARCGESGVNAVISVGVNLDDARHAVRLADRFPKRVFVSAGFHPHEAGKVSAEDLDAMETLWSTPCVVALGEMGLDYHYDFADRAAQRDVFSRQLERALTLNKPVVIHCREAFDDTLSILADHGYHEHPVVFHCFTGTQVEAARLAEHGWRISFTGIVTFPKSTELQEIAREYPADALMIETDSPYLSPVPVRGKRPNEPANVAHIARFLADLRGVSVDALAEQTGRNARYFFGLSD